MLAHIKSSIVLYNESAVASRSARNGGLWLKSALLLALIAFASAGGAGVALPKRVFDIEAQDLSRALIRFSEQSGLVFVIPVELIKGKKSAAAKGYLTPVEALARLLAGSGLAGKINAEGLLHIALAEPARGDANNGERAMKQKTDGELRKKSFFSAVAGVVSTLAVGLTATGGAVIAQETGFVLEEIVVTAQKREQNLQDVGISVTAFGGQQLEELNLNNSNELVYMTPGLTLGNPGGEGNITSLSLRGIGQGDFNDHQESPVAVYQDEVYDAYMGATNTTLFDLERVEVLRGPQGTLFGRNATGGLVHYISRKPTKAFSAYGNFSFAEENHVRFEGAAGGGLTDSLSLRVSGFVNNHDPFVKNIGTGNDGNEADTWAARGQLLFEPADNLAMLLKFEYYETDITQWYYETAPATVDAQGRAVLLDPPPPGSEILDGDPFVVNNDGAVGLVAARGASPEGLKRDGVKGSFRLDYELGNGATLTSITAMSEQNKFFNQESDGLPASLITFATDTNAQQLSQELRLAGETGNWRWVTGMYYLSYDSDIVLDVGFFAPSAFVTDQEVETESWSVFGQVEWDFAPDWTLIAGLRYLDEKKEIDASGGIAGFVLGVPVPYVRTTFNVTDSPLAKLKEDDVVAKLQLNWQPHDSLLLYAGVSRGVKAGGFNAAFGAPGIISSTDSYSKETPIAYEAGFKSTLLGGRAKWNTSFYYYDYQNYQAFAFIPPTQLSFNTDAEVYGVDSNLLLTPVEGLDLDFGVNIMDAEAKDVTNRSGFTADRGLPNAPDAQFTGMARYTWQAWNGNMAVQGDFNYQSSNSFTIYDDPATSIGGYIVGNARLSYASGDERWSVALFVKNIGDKEYITSISNNSGFPPGLAHVQRFYARPRWVGGQLIHHWN